MLTKVVIKDFRSCRDVTLDGLGPTCVLVGPNGSGKSNILRAIEGAARFAIQSHGIRHDESTVVLEFQTEASTYRYSLAPHIDGAPGPNITADESISILSSDGSWTALAERSRDSLTMSGRKIDGREQISVGAGASFLNFLLVSPTISGPNFEHFRRIERYLGAIRYYPFDEPSESDAQLLIRTRDFESWAARYDASSDPADDVLMKLLYLRHRDSERYEEVVDILGAEGLGLVSVHTHQIAPHKPDPNGWSGHDEGFEYVSFTPTGGPRSGLSYAELSHGTRRVVRMIVSMLFDRSSVMLVEHPEDGVHRDLAWRVFSRLRSYTEPMQMIATSHSEQLFDMLDPSEIRLVSMTGEGTKARGLSKSEMGRARRYVKESGRFSEFLQLSRDR